jgi:dTDP-glucose 4,6-dehydratase/UDP-glucose 4-epimerase
MKLCHFHDGGRYQLIPFPPERKAIDIGDYYSDYSLIKNELEWNPLVSLDEGLKRVVSYYQKNRLHYWSDLP